MRISFAKYHGTGNDFILVDGRRPGFSLTTDVIAHLCHRHYGIGADGLIMLTEKAGYDFSMSYYNSDGGESTMCGNGGRCITAFAYRLGIIGTDAVFHATDGSHEGKILEGGHPHAIIRVRLRDTEVGPTTPAGTFINTGSPHLVRFVPDVWGMDVIREGRRIRNSRKFAESGVNVDFVERVKDTLHVRTYERGVEDETLSCGTGVTAAALVTASKFQPVKCHYNIKTKGGDLTVFFRQNRNSFADVWLEGPVAFIFDGEISL